jgi:hypothetical protein
VAACRERYGAGEPIVDLTRAFGVHPNTMRGAIKGHTGATSRPTRRTRRFGCSKNRSPAAGNGEPARNGNSSPLTSCLARPQARVARLEWTSTSSLWRIGRDARSGPIPAPVGSAPSWHRLNFSPLPHGQGCLRRILGAIGSPGRKIGRVPCSVADLPVHREPSTKRPISDIICVAR